MRTLNIAKAWFFEEVIQANWIMDDISDFSDSDESEDGFDQFLRRHRQVRQTPEVPKLPDTPRFPNLKLLDIEMLKQPKASFFTFFEKNAPNLQFIKIGSRILEPDEAESWNQTEYLVGARCQTLSIPADIFSHVVIPKGLRNLALTYWRSSKEKKGQCETMTKIQDSSIEVLCVHLVGIDKNIRKEFEFLMDAVQSIPNLKVLAFQAAPGILEKFQINKSIEQWAKSMNHLEFLLVFGYVMAKKPEFSTRQEELDLLLKTNCFWRDDFYIQRVCGI